MYYFFLRHASLSTLLHCVNNLAPQAEERRGETLVGSKLRARSASPSARRSVGRKTWHHKLKSVVVDLGGDLYCLFGTAPRELEAAVLGRGQARCIHAATFGWVSMPMNSRVTPPVEPQMSMYTPSALWSLP